MMIKNVFFILLFSVGAISLGAGLIMRPVAIPASIIPMLGALPYVLGIGAAIIGWWFKTSRVMLMSMVIVGAYWMVSTFVPDLEHAGGNTRELMLVYAALAVLFPINGALIAGMSDHGMTFKGVIGRVLFLGVQGLLLVVVWDAGFQVGSRVDAMLHMRLFSTSWDYWSLLPQPAILLFSVVGFGLLVRAVRSARAIDGGLFGAVTMTGFALHTAGQGALPDLLFSLAILALLVAVMQEGYRLAYIDELTNLPGRRALMLDLKALSGRYTVAMLDVDHFKKFNDRYGHDVGDQVLKLVAAQMGKVTGGGRAFRYGGEEFTILFMKKSAAEALPHLDGLRRAIAGASFQLRDAHRPKDKPDRPPLTKAGSKTAKRKKTDDQVSVTISIGAAEHETGKTPDEILKAADQALYRAKDGGRNRVSV